MAAKPFEKENDLAQLKKDVSKLEREISVRIQENQMKQQNVPAETNLIEKERPVKQRVKSLLPKRENDSKKAKGISM